MVGWVCSAPTTWRLQGPSLAPWGCRVGSVGGSHCTLGTDSSVRSAHQVMKGYPTSLRWESHASGLAREKGEAYVLSMTYSKY